MVFLTDDGREYPVRVSSEIVAEWPSAKQELLAASKMADEDPERQRAERARGGKIWPRAPGRVRTSTLPAWFARAVVRS